MDLKEKSNSICLTNQIEKCLLIASNKENTFIWLELLCNYCDFNQTSENNTSIDIRTGNKGIETSKNIPKKSAAKNIIGKTIAGNAASSVGSYDLCNPYLENIFRKKSNPEMKKIYNQSNRMDFNQCSILVESDHGLLPKDYIDLNNCMSGLETEQISQLNESIGSNLQNGSRKNIVNMFQSSNSLDQLKMIRDLNKNFVSSSENVSLNEFNSYSQVSKISKILISFLFIIILISTESIK